MSEDMEKMNILVIDEQKPLTIKQDKYAQGLFTGLSQREAYKEAYNCENMTDKSIDELACRAANSIKIMSRIACLKQELTNRNIITVEKVIDEISHIAFNNISNYLEYTQEDGIVRVTIRDSAEVDTRGLSEVSVNKDGSFKFKLYDKSDALVQLGKILGIFKDQLETTTRIIVGIEDNED